MSGAAVRVPSPAAAGPAGLLPPQGRAAAGVLQGPGQAGRALLGQDTHVAGAPAVQVSEAALTGSTPPKILCVFMYG